MSTLWETINYDLKIAMKAKDELDLSVLRMLLSSFKYKIIELKLTEEIGDDLAIQVIGAEIKKRKDSIVSFKKGDRPDLVEQEQKEIKVLEKYVPKQVSAEEIEKVVREIIEPMEEADMNYFGAVMGQAMSKLAGKVDGNDVKDMVMKILSN